jgi:hypothetical protein
MITEFRLRHKKPNKWSAEPATAGVFADAIHEPRLGPVIQVVSRATAAVDDCQGGG